MGKKQRGTKVMNNGARRGRLAWAWSLLAVATAICVSVGACALLLPDRAPALLGSAGETTTAPASVQEYSGSQQVTVVPTISTERNLLGNANGTVTADWSADGLASGKGTYKVNDRVVVALNTATPLYRDLKTGDKGDDVLALNKRAEPTRIQQRGRFRHLLVGNIRRLAATHERQRQPLRRHACACRHHVDS